MSVDIDLLATLSTKESYQRYGKFIKKHLVTKEVWTIFRDLGDWYKVNKDVDWGSFAAWFKLVKHASMQPDALAVYDAMFTRLTNHNPPKGTELDVIKSLITRDYATRLSEYTGDIADGQQGDLSKVETIMREYNRETGRAQKLEDQFVSDDVTDMLNVVQVAGGLEWRLRELQLMLGPIRKGDCITVAARPDSGKTTLLAAEASYMAEQMQDKKVFWFCNEEDGQKVQYRLMQAAVGCTTPEFLNDPQGVRDKYLKLTGGRVRLLHNTRLHINDVLTVCEQYEDQLGLIIIDQLHKVKGYDDQDKEYSKYPKLWEWARELSGQAPVIVSHQLKGEAEGTLFPEMHLLFGSSTMIQGECDAIVTLGRAHDAQFSENTRGLYAPKNKLVGDLSTNGQYRNHRFEVEIQPERARFTGAMK